MAKRLTSDERARIEAHSAAGAGADHIAEMLGRHRSTVYRELDRGRDRDGVYRAEAAQAAAQRRARCPKVPKLEGDSRLAGRMRCRLKRGWSPHAVSADLAVGGTRVCAETIYRAAYSGCGLGSEAWKLLPRRRRCRRRRARSGERASPLGEMRPLSGRPLAAADRSEAGHWEGDLIVDGANRSAEATLVERVSRHALVVPLPYGCKAPQVAQAVTDALGRQPAHLVRTLTWDQGREMARWADIEAALGIEVFFCDPTAPGSARPTSTPTGCCAAGSPTAHPSTSARCGSASSRTTSTGCPAGSTTGNQPPTSTLNSVATTNRACPA